jgi:hypothetical protein
VSDSIYFKYGVLPKPVLADRDGEVVVNWTAGGNHTLSADVTHAWAGTKSFKVSASGIGDFTTNCIELSSANNATLVVGKKYVQAIHAYSVSAGVFQLQTGDVVSANLTCVAGAWTTIHFVFTAVTAATKFQLAMVSVVTDVWFELEPLYEGDEFSVLLEKGLTRAEFYSYFPELMFQGLDGSLRVEYMAFIRQLKLRTDTLTSAQMKTYLYWGLDNNNRKVDYDIDGIQESELTLVPSPKQEFRWNDDFKMTPYLETVLSEGIVRNVFPV